MGAHSGCEFTPGSSPDNPPAAHRTRVVSGSRIVPLGDGRGLWARILKDTLHSLQTHCGGSLSETQRLMARRVSTLEAELCFLEDQFARVRAEGGEPNPNKVELYGRLADRQRRLAESALGWRPTARDITPSLGDILREDYARQEFEACEVDHAE
jgi:hypothetical protein